MSKSAEQTLFDKALRLENRAIDAAARRDHAAERKLRQDANRHLEEACAIAA